MTHTQLESIKVIGYYYPNIQSTSLNAQTEIFFLLTLQLSASSSSTFLAAKSRCTNDFLERYAMPEAICFENRKKHSPNFLALCLLHK